MILQAFSYRNDAVVEVSGAAALGSDAGAAAGPARLPCLRRAEPGLGPAARKVGIAGEGAAEFRGAMWVLSVRTVAPEMESHS